MTRSRVVVSGGRDSVDEIADVRDELLTRGLDVGLYVRGPDGRQTLVPGIQSLTLRVDGRKAIATVEIEVDDVDVTAVWLEEIKQGPTKFVRLRRRSSVDD